MDAGGLSVIQQLKGRMHWLQARQKLLAENVANADMPGFRPKDLVESSARGGLGVAVTDAGHLDPLPGFGLANGRAVQFETRPSGNAVSLEDEMMKVADTQIAYQAAASLYNKSLQLMRIAIGKK